MKEKVKNSKELKIWREMYPNFTNFAGLSYIQWIYNLRGWWTDNDVTMNEGAD